MTQVELDLLAREMRARGLHSSWRELLTFSEDVVGSLIDANQALLKSTAKSDSIYRGDPDDVPRVVRDKLAGVLTLLTSREQVAKWKSEALVGNNITGTREVESSRFGEDQS